MALHPASQIGGARTGQPSLQQQFLSMDEEGFVLGMEDPGQPAGDTSLDRHISTGVLLAGQNISSTIETTILTEESIFE